MKQYTLKKIALLLGFCLGLWTLYTYTPLADYISLAYVQKQSSFFKDAVDMHYWLVVAAYLAIFTMAITFSIPASIVLTLLGGYLFGALAGAFYATLAVAIGVTLAYLALTLFLKDMLRKSYKDKAERFERAMKEHGVSYLLMLNFSAIFPYFIINTLAALSHVPVTTVVWTTVIGFLPQAIVYAYAGKGLATLKQVQDLFSREIIFAFILLILLALMPILIKRYKKQVEL